MQQLLGGHSVPQRCPTGLGWREDRWGWMTGHGVLWAQRSVSVFVFICALAYERDWVAEGICKSECVTMHGPRWGITSCQSDLLDIWQTGREIRQALWDAGGSPEEQPLSQQSTIKIRGMQLGLPLSPASLKVEMDASFYLCGLTTNTVHI